jgi:acetyl esterase/lipase
MSAVTCPLAAAYRGIASQLASRTRRPVVLLGYPLAPEATVPAAEAVSNH